MDEDQVDAETLLDDEPEWSQICHTQTRSHKGRQCNTWASIVPAEVFDLADNDSDIDNVNRNDTVSDIEGVVDGVEGRMLGDGDVGTDLHVEGISDVRSLPRFLHVLFRNAMKMVLEEILNGVVRTKLVGGKFF